MPDLGIYTNLKNTVFALESALRISISNADNFNTPAYKYITPSFTSVYSQLVRPGTKSENPLSLGASMTIGATATDYTQGNLSLGTALDAAIVGEGFFVLGKSASDATTQNEAFTRNGRFVLDSNNNFLKDAFGRPVMGYAINPDGSVNKSELVPIRTNGNSDVGFTDNGILVTNFEAKKSADSQRTTPPAQTPLYQLALTTFKNKQGLVVTNGGAYLATVASGAPSHYGVSEENGLGAVRGETIESSNVDVSRVSLDLNQLNRGFSAVQGVIDDVNRITDKMMQSLSSF